MLSLAIMDDAAAAPPIPSAPGKSSNLSVSSMASSISVMWRRMSCRAMSWAASISMLIPSPGHSEQHNLPSTR